MDNDVIEVSVLREQVSKYANKDCRDCDGTGIFYGNVSICSCVLLKIPSQEVVVPITVRPASIASEDSLPLDPEEILPSVY